MCVRNSSFPDAEEQMAQSPIANYSERDLVRFVSGSVFAEIHLAFHIDIVPSIITSWDVFLGSSPHPWAPSVSAILAKQFTLEERQLFEQVLRPTVEGCQSTTTERKPTSPQKSHSRDRRSMSAPSS